MEDNSTKFQLYLDAIVRWNKKINLVSRNDIPHLKKRHLKDSLIASAKIPLNSIVADIGSGNGFPVIPLAIERGDCIFHAFEVREKRSIFLETVKRQLSLTNLFVHNERVEQGSIKHKKLADVLISRAFKNNVIFVETAFELLKTSALVISYNKLLELEIQKIKEKNKVKIENVDNYVYNFEDNIKRVLSSFFIHKED